MLSNKKSYVVAFAIAAYLAFVVLVPLDGLGIGARAAAVKDAKNVQLTLASYEAVWETFPIGIYDGDQLCDVLADWESFPHITPDQSDAMTRQGWYRYPSDRSNNGYEACLRYDGGRYNLMVTSEKITAISADSADMLEVVNAMDEFAQSLRWIRNRYDVELPATLHGIVYQEVAGQEAYSVFAKSYADFLGILDKFGYTVKEYYRTDFSDAESTFHLVVRSPVDGTYLMTNNQGTGICDKALTFAPPLD
jgi:hypothetical protein